MRSHKQLLMDGENPGELCLTEDAEYMSICDDAEQSTLSEKADSRSILEQEPLIACPLLHTEPSELMNSATRPTADLDNRIKMELNTELESCKNKFRSKSFIVNCGENLDTINPDEIDVFFSAFEESNKFIDWQLMSLLFSFNWSMITLVLHSSYLQDLYILDGKLFGLRVPWPLRPDHDRIILPCYFNRYWTLFDIDLKSRTVKNYNSLMGVVIPENLIAVIE